jgi:hypothetical protein
MAMTHQINEESSITTDHDRTDAPHKELEDVYTTSSNAITQPIS